MACGGAFRATLLKSNRSAVCLSNPHRFLVTKHSGGVEYIKPPNFNYLRYGYSPERVLLDRTYKRLNENSKVLVVEGSIGVGKAGFAKKLAEAFDLKFVPDVSEDDIWIAELGDELIDLREYNAFLPDSAKFYTLPMLFNDPDPINKGKPLALQYQYLIARHWNYCVEMSHLFNTGRGFVMDRSPHSDFTFAKAMLDVGLMSKEAYDFYYYARRNAVPSLWKPHVVVYLRAPLEMVKQRIAERNIPWEVSGRNMTDKFLLALHKSLENDYLERMRTYSEVLEINCEELDIHDDEDVNFVVEEIARLDLDGDDLDDLDKKFLQWRDGLHNRDSMDYFRILHSDANESCLKIFNNIRIPFRLREGKYSNEDLALQDHVMNVDPRCDWPAGMSLKRNSLVQRLFGFRRIPQNLETVGHHYYLFK